MCIIVCDPLSRDCNRKFISADSRSLSILHGVPCGFKQLRESESRIYVYSDKGHCTFILRFACCIHGRIARGSGTASITNIINGTRPGHIRNPEHILCQALTSSLVPGLAAIQRRHRTHACMHFIHATAGRPLSGSARHLFVWGASRQHYLGQRTTVQYYQMACSIGTCALIMKA